LGARAASLFAVLLACVPAAHGQRPAFAAPNLSESGVRDMAANCAPCHGTRGRPVPGSNAAGLAGRTDVATLLRAFRDGKRDSTVMQQIAKGYGEAEIDAMGGYFARQPR
jgi:cytochrome subunit of sulfide dehydrogenase